ncbi:Lysozyme 3,Lysozyme 2,Lysozyme 1,Invertebrate-type lysozyme,Lysozyme [Mytilus coruscus]|uniref:lysozyme n=1 Tax=Mytilus coruscus TaxID=42192 RepID=A0A6J8DP76_MYTCO|nr:Lysozyme 3,Lysozyme 2,Lysozyme 1,Invertebrate-type lysozyme,Lysozyme [Mytilus coruscus]
MSIYSKCKEGSLYARKLNMGHISTQKMSYLAAIFLTVFTVIMQKKDNVNAAIHLTATPYLQTFVSHDTYDGAIHYPEGNYSRDWLVTGQILNYKITIEFIECVLETGNNKGVCITDKVFVYDGTNASATLIKETCCGIGDTVPFTVQSTYGYMYVIFQTDNTVSMEGFRISYILEGAPTTTAQVTTNTNHDSKLPMYIAVGCAVLVASIVLFISASVSRNQQFQRMLPIQLSLQIVVVILTINAGMIFAGISNSCLSCICEVESNCDSTIGCHDDGGSDSCGPFQIKRVYWIDCGEPGHNFTTCAKDYNCAKGCVQNYMERYGGWRCGTTCEDYARMHNGGPRGCRKRATNRYWNKIRAAGCSRYS